MGQREGKTKEATRRRSEGMERRKDDEKVKKSSAGTDSGDESWCRTGRAWP